MSNERARDLLRCELASHHFGRAALAASAVVAEHEGGQREHAGARLDVDVHVVPAGLQHRFQAFQAQRRIARSLADQPVLLAVGQTREPRAEAGLGRESAVPIALPWVSAWPLTLLERQPDVLMSVVLTVETSWMPH